MLSSFRSIRFGLMVGIGGGSPSLADIRLGDVVVGKPTTAFGGVVQYDYGKTIRDGVFERTGTLNKPPRVLLTALSKLQANHLIHGSQIPRLLSEIMNPTFMPQDQDRLFHPEYHHTSSGVTCDECDQHRLMARTPRGKHSPKIHYGVIASGNWVLKDGCTRDRLAREYNILCFEMEAAGLMDNFPCLVIRGISDYADSHKNKAWQGYAAATAAAYTKELLSVVPTKQVEDTTTVSHLNSIS
ncbi:purine and uridine phosphorylase [Penicillium desertorum]|uniref:Purine and uridine phosphorylase n=1 Tax=Penicillium desertorum TaxID=1303715 RepID=A0A9X0BS86_9EURO|nr:purine and uridine phosphorylase [Penicillium desertorum]